jgi:hypothetical protein
MTKIVNLYEEQQAEWEEFRLRVLQLDTVELKEIPMGNFSVFAQFNPARAVSSNAKLDAKSIANRKCFLCQQNRPDIQRGIALNERFEALVNPFPILKGHLTIVNREHRNQEILPVISDFIDFTKAMPHFTLFYNGPSCGASAPDHMHFQAVFRGQLPFEKDVEWKEKNILSESTSNPQRQRPCGKIEQWKNYGRTVIHITSEDKNLAISYFSQIYKQYQLLSGEDGEPKMNLFGYYEKGEYHLFIFPRKKHRPDCFFAEGDDYKMISPGAIDIAGILVLPRKEDFDLIDASLISKVFVEVGF